MAAHTRGILPPNNSSFDIWIEFPYSLLYRRCFRHALTFEGESAAFARVVLTLGVRDSAREEFWRYLRRAAASHRRYFAHAVTLAAMGYHFRKLTEVHGK